MIPHLFSKELIPTISNQDLLRSIEEVKLAKNKREAIEIAFNLITKKYRGFRFRTYLFFWKAFEKDPNTLWEHNGFLHCTQMNYLLRVLLIKSEWFTENEIKLGYSFVWFVSIHQYLIVSVNGKEIALDPWNYYYGYPMGTYAHGFGWRNL